MPIQTGLLCLRAPAGCMDGRDPVPTSVPMIECMEVMQNIRHSHKWHDEMYLRGKNSEIYRLPFLETFACHSTFSSPLRNCQPSIESHETGATNHSLMLQQTSTFRPPGLLCLSALRSCCAGANPWQLTMVSHVDHAWSAMKEDQMRDNAIRTIPIRN